MAFNISLPSSSDGKNLASLYNYIYKLAETMRYSLSVLEQKIDSQSTSASSTEEQKSIPFINAVDGSVLDYAKNAAPIGASFIMTTASTTDVPSVAYNYSVGFIVKRDMLESNVVAKGITTSVVLMSSDSSNMAINVCDNGYWDTWKEFN